MTEHKTNVVNTEERLPYALAHVVVTVMRFNAPLMRAFHEATKHGELVISLAENKSPS